MNTLAHAAPSLLRIHVLEAWFEFLRVLRTPAFAIPSLAFPVVFYVLFAILLPGQWGGYQKSAYLLATYGAFGVIGPALFGFGVGMAMERESGLLELKRVSPMPIRMPVVIGTACSPARRKVSRRTSGCLSTHFQCGPPRSHRRVEDDSSMMPIEADSGRSRAISSALMVPGFRCARPWRGQALGPIR